LVTFLNCTLTKEGRNMPVRIGIIAIGGKGSRLGQSYIQKCLVPIEGKPLVEYTIDAFVDNGIKLIIFLTGFLHEQVSSYLIQRYGTNAKFVPATVFGGTTGLGPALSTLRHFINEDFIFAHGDFILKHRVFSNFIQEGERLSDSVAVMLVTKDTSIAPTPSFVRVESDNITVRTIRLPTPRRRPGLSDLVDIGLCYFRPEVFQFLSMVKPDKHLASFIRPARRAGYKISAITTAEPCFFLHTQEDIEKWETAKTSLFPLT